MTSRYWLGMENAAPAGVAPRLLVATFPRPLLGPPSLSVLADTVIARLIMASLQSGSLIAAMKPGDRLTNGSVSNNQTLARVFRPLMAGRLPELSWVKLVPLNCKVWACTEVGLPAGASSNANRPLPSGTRPVTLARVFRPLMAGRVPELSWVKLVPLNCKVWACTEVGLPAGASSNAQTLQFN